MKIRVVASFPLPGQDGIDDLVGKTYKVLHWDKATGEVSVNAPIYGGTIVLSRREWRPVMSRPKKNAIVSADGEKKYKPADCPHFNLKSGCKSPLHLRAVHRLSKSDAGWLVIDALKEIVRVYGKKKLKAAVETLTK